MVLARLDYGNVTLNGITTRLMNRLQSVLNAAVRLGCSLTVINTTAFHHFCVILSLCSRTNKVPFGRSSVLLPQPDST